LNGRRRLANSWKIDSATQQMTIDTDKPMSIEGYVSVTSLGDVSSNLVPFSISVCDSPILKVKTQGISNLVKPVFHLNEDGGAVIIPKTVWGRFVEANKCNNCAPNVDIVSTGISTFAGPPDGLTFDKDENIVIDTTSGRDFSGAIVVSYDGDCADL
jgi:hypothetical protein